jgi:hypothetical protein
VQINPYDDHPETQYSLLFNIGNNIKFYLSNCRVEGQMKNSALPTSKGITTEN